MAWDSAVLTTQNREHLNTLEAKQAHLVFQYFTDWWRVKVTDSWISSMNEHTPIGNLSLIPTGDDGYRCRQEGVEFPGV